MISKFNSYINKLNECYPVAITEYREEVTEPCQSSEPSSDLCLQFIEEKRLAALLDLLIRTLKRQVVNRCCKVLELGPEKTLDISTETLSSIASQIVILAEREPYGVRGGTLVVMFGPPLSSPNSKSEKIGKFPLDPSVVSTYELHLTLRPIEQIKLKLTNLVRRLQGKKGKVVVDEKFTLEKKKLYRSSTSH